MNNLHPTRTARALLRLLSLYLLPFSLSHAQSLSLLRVALLPAYAAGTPTRISPSNSNTLQPYGLGVGIRLEYLFELGVSIGGIFVAHRGESAHIVTPDGIPVRLETRMRYGGIEIGYSVPLPGQFIIHPRLGVGLGEPVGNFSAEAAGSNDLTTIPNSSSSYGDGMTIAASCGE